MSNVTPVQPQVLVSVAQRSLTGLILGTWVVIGCWFYSPVMVLLLWMVAVSLSREVLKLHTRPPTAMIFRRSDYWLTGSAVVALATFHTLYPLHNVHRAAVFELACLLVTVGLLHDEVAGNMRVSAEVVMVKAAMITMPLAWLTALLREPHGRHYLLVFAIFIVSSDVGGYAFGMGCKLLPMPGPLRILRRTPAQYLSPKKTIAGFMGAVLIGPAMASLTISAWLPLSRHWLVVLAITLGALGQIGDLYMSSLKRLFGVKDYANKIFGVLPGMGGIGDRVDSILFTTPVYYIVLFASGQLAF